MREQQATPPAHLPAWPPAFVSFVVADEHLDNSGLFGYFDGPELRRSQMAGAGSAGAWRDPRVQRLVRVLQA